jgi:hypothetical protein
MGRARLGLHQRRIPDRLIVGAAVRRGVDSSQSRSLKRDHPGRRSPPSSDEVLADLDARFFRVRFDLLTPAEKIYMRAMAALDAGPHRSGDIADRLGRKVTNGAPVRNVRIEKGMIYSPAHGDTAFTAPLFDGFMRRIMPTP